MTNGFICYRKGALEALDFGSFVSEGHFYQTEMKIRLHRNGCRIKEIYTPFNLSPSTLKKKEIVEALKVLIKI